MPADLKDQTRNIWNEGRSVREAQGSDDPVDNYPLMVGSLKGALEQARDAKDDNLANMIQNAIDAAETKMKTKKESAEGYLRRVAMTEAGGSFVATVEFERSKAEDAEFARTNYGSDNNDALVKQLVSELEEAGLPGKATVKSTRFSKDIYYVTIELTGTGISSKQDLHNTLQTRLYDDGSVAGFFKIKTFAVK